MDNGSGTFINGHLSTTATFSVPNMAVLERFDCNLIIIINNQIVLNSNNSFPGTFPWLGGRAPKPGKSFWERG